MSKTERYVYLHKIFQSNDHYIHCHIFRLTCYKVRGFDTLPDTWHTFHQKRMYHHYILFKHVSVNYLNVRVKEKENNIDWCIWHWIFTIYFLFTYHLPVSHCLPIQPYSHPPLQAPVTVEHGMPSLQCPHFFEQLGPCL